MKVIFGVQTLPSSELPYTYGIIALHYVVPCEYAICLSYMDRKACLACNFNCLSKLKDIPRSRAGVHCKRYTVARLGAVHVTLGAELRVLRYVDWVSGGAPVPLPSIAAPFPV